MYPQLIQDFLADEKLPSSYGDDFNTWVAPFLSSLENTVGQSQSKPFFLGVNGAQGSGKSTFSKLTTTLLEAKRFQVACLSIDDFYLSKKSRRELAQDKHPLLGTRGVPGTHDVPLLRTCLERLNSPAENKTVLLPRFDKAKDDRVPECEFTVQQLPIDLIILEGWFIGAKAVDDAALAQPINELEAGEDSEGSWRRFVNTKLREEYEPVFSQLDALVVLQAPSFEQVYAWRGLQEQKLKLQRGDESEVMNEQELQRFIQHYERITRQCLQDLPERADLTFILDETHRFTAVQDRLWRSKFGS